MNRNVLIGVAVMALLVVFSAWAWGWFEGGNYSDDPAVAELERARDEAVAKHDQLTDDQKRAERQAFEEKAKSLTPEQRMALFESSMPVMIPLFAKQFEKRYDEFMAMSPEEQRKKLDERIDEMEARRGSGQGPGAGGGPRDGGDRPPVDEKKAQEFRKKMLDWTTPEQRAKFENGIKLMNDRRKERGLEPIGPPGRGGGFF